MRGSRSGQQLREPNHPGPQSRQAASPEVLSTAAVQGASSGPTLRKVPEEASPRHYNAAPARARSRSPARCRWPGSADQVPSGVGSPAANQEHIAATPKAPGRYMRMGGHGAPLELCAPRARSPLTVPTTERPAGAAGRSVVGGCRRQSSLATAGLVAKWASRPASPATSRSSRGSRRRAEAPTPVSRVGLPRQLHLLRSQPFTPRPA